MEWQSIQQDIQSCRRCEAEAIPYLHVPCGEKRSPPWEPRRPILLYFVSVAPPWGGVYFWDESMRDAVREGLFTALREPKVKKLLGVTVTSCRQFRDLRLFLTPAVKCPSSNGKRDHQPLRAVVRHCTRFLYEELLAAEPERILALGKVPFESVCKMFGINAPKKVELFRQRVVWVQLGSRQVPFSGTYFVGTKRHKGFPCIVEDITQLLELNPRSTSG